MPAAPTSAGAPLKVSNAAPLKSPQTNSESQNMGADNQFSADFGASGEQSLGTSGDMESSPEFENQTGYEGDSFSAEAESNPEFDDDKPGVVTWVFLFVVAGALDLLGIIPVVGEIMEPLAVIGFRYVLKLTGATTGGWLINIVTGTLAVAEVIPGISEFLPGCLAEVTTALILKRTEKRVKEVVRALAPIARGVQEVASKIPVPQAQVVGAVAGGIASTSDALDRGENLDNAVASGVVEGASGAVAGLAGGAAGGAAGSTSGSTAGAASAGRQAGVGKQYGVGKGAGGGGKGAPIKSRLPGGSAEEGNESILEKVKENAEEEDFFPGNPFVTDDLYADAPDQQTGGRKEGRKDQPVSGPKKLKPKQLPGKP